MVESVVRIPTASVQPGELSQKDLRLPEPVVVSVIESTDNEPSPVLVVGIVAHGEIMSYDELDSWIWQGYVTLWLIQDRSSVARRGHGLRNERDQSLLNVPIWLGRWFRMEVICVLRPPNTMCRITAVEEDRGGLSLGYVSVPTRKPRHEELKMIFETRGVGALEARGFMLILGD